MTPVVTLVDACLRNGRGGSPTAVVDESAPDNDGLTDAVRRRVPTDLGTSHAVFLRHRGPAVGLRFFTAEGELPACGHGTVAALAVLAAWRGPGERRHTLRTADRTVAGRTVRDGDLVHAGFDPGPVTLREAAPAAVAAVSDALGIAPGSLAARACVASLGRARMLVPLATPEAVAALAPDLDRLRAACDALGLLGCYVHSAPPAGGRVVARMFAPSIGVPEDIANANSTACLAAHFAAGGPVDLAVDMGDAVGRPATVTASARPGPGGPAVLVGGAAVVKATGRV